MTDARFGVFLSPHVDRLPQLVDKAEAAEAGGFDYVLVQDHPYVSGHLDTFAVVSHLIARTTRLRFMTDVANLPLRPAPMLAKASASIDRLSGGRFELGLGGGRSWDEIAALGGPRWSPGETVTAVGDAIDALRALWSTEREVSVDSKHYPISGALGGPLPHHPIGISLGVAGPRMLDLVGRKADGWITPIGTDTARRAVAHSRIDAAAREAGRRPADIRRVVQLVGSIDAHHRVASAPARELASQKIRADPATWAHLISALLTEEPFAMVNFVPAVETVDQIDAFANEVIPRVLSRLDGTHES